MHYTEFIKKLYNWKLNTSRRIAHKKGEAGNDACRKICHEADELAKDGALLDGGEMAQMRASTVQRKGEEVHAGLQQAASFYCLVEEWHDCEDNKPKGEVEMATCGPKRGGEGTSGVKPQADPFA